MTRVLEAPAASLKEPVPFAADNMVLRSNGTTSGGDEAQISLETIIQSLLALAATFLAGC
jgi:hypothetical protein